MTPAVYVGWDPREPEAYRVAEASLRRWASAPVAVVPLRLGEPPVSDWLTRPVERRDGKLWCPISGAPMATEFAVSRFVVPLVQKDGWALFVDCDVLFRADVAELFALADDRFAARVVKRDRADQGGAVKMDGQPQTQYPRKNFSSVVLWNCGHPANRRLTREMLNTLPGRDLHRFCWLGDHEIGHLPFGWNHLVGVDPAEEAAAAKVLHYTLGTPELPGCENGPLADLWLAERDGGGGGAVPGGRMPG